MLRNIRKAVITGATGEIGTALVRELTEHGIEVLVLCREGSSRNDRIPDHPLVQKVFCDMSRLCEIQNGTDSDFDVFFHFAWAGTTGQMRNNMYLQNKNIEYALDAVGAAQRLGCRLFVGAGSQAEYGRFEGRLRPDTPVNPENGYGMAKLCAGEMTREYAHRLGMEHIWTRILSVYGPNDGANSMVTSTILKLLKGETPQFTKGEQLWDYLYSGDAAKAFRLIAENGMDGKIYVIGSGNARPLAEYIEDIRDVVAPDAEIRLGAVPYSDRQVMHLQADISELTADTGFFPETEFREGIRLTAENLKN